MRLLAFYDSATYCLCFFKKKKTDLEGSKGIFIKKKEASKFKLKRT